MPNRDEFPTCPDCAVALQPYGSRLGCDRCGGTLVTEAELSELLSSFDPKHPRTLAWAKVERASRRQCPRCEAIMMGAHMEEIAVEHCVEHGVWFDTGELARVLAPDADPVKFAQENAERRNAADRLEYSPLSLVIRGVYRAIRARLGRPR